MGIAIRWILTNSPGVTIFNSTGLFCHSEGIWSRSILLCGHLLVWYRAGLPGPAEKNYNSGWSVKIFSLWKKLTSEKKEKKIHYKNLQSHVTSEEGVISLLLMLDTPRSCILGKGPTGLLVNPAHAWYHKPEKNELSKILITLQSHKDLNNLELYSVVILIITAHRRVYRLVHWVLWIPVIQSHVYHWYNTICLLVALSLYSEA